MSDIHILSVVCTLLAIGLIACAVANVNASKRIKALSRQLLLTDTDFDTLWDRKWLDLDWDDIPGMDDLKGEVEQLQKDFENQEDLDEWWDRKFPATLEEDVQSLRTELDDLRSDFENQEC